MLRTMFRKGLVGLFALVLVLSLSGCNLGTDVWALLRAPHLTGEQDAVQTALDEYLKNTQNKDTANGNGAYELKYPKSGDYRSAFILKDLDGDGKEEAIAFYRRGLEGTNVHINLLRQEDSKWVSVSDMEGESADVERVRFGDLDGDGVQEVMVGWNIDNIRDKQFVLYSVNNNQLNPPLGKRLYSAAVVGDLTGCGHDNLLLIYSNADDNATIAQLWTLQVDPATRQTKLAESDPINIDGYIQQFGNSHIGKITGTQNGAYIDGIRTSGGMVTELIYWDGTQLQAPFYNAQNNSTNVTYREAPIPSADVDGDGIIEWPSTQRLDGYSPSSSADMLWLTSWKYMDMKTQNGTQTITDKFTCIMNLTDGYYLRLDTPWVGQVTATFDSETHLLKMYTMEDDVPVKEILALRKITLSGMSHTTEASDFSEPDTDSHTYRVLEDLSNVRYEVWYSTDSPFNFDLESIRYMFTLINNQ